MLFAAFVEIFLQIFRYIYNLFYFKTSLEECFAFRKLRGKGRGRQASPGNNRDIRQSIVESCMRSCSTSQNEKQTSFFAYTFYNTGSFLVYAFHCYPLLLLLHLQACEVLYTISFLRFYQKIYLLINFLFDPACFYLINLNIEN